MLNSRNPTANTFSLKARLGLITPAGYQKACPTDTKFFIGVPHAG